MGFARMKPVFLVKHQVFFPGNSWVLDALSSSCGKPRVGNWETTLPKNGCFIPLAVWKFLDFSLFDKV